MVGDPGGSAAMRWPARAPPPLPWDFLGPCLGPSWALLGPKPATLETAMPAITSLTLSAASPFARALVALAGRAGRGLKRIAERIKNRRDAMRLVDLDDRMLADIGITR